MASEAVAHHEALQQDVRYSMFCRKGDGPYKEKSPSHELGAVRQGQAIRNAFVTACVKAATAEKVHTLTAAPHTSVAQIFALELAEGMQTN